VSMSPPICGRRGNLWPARNASLKFIISPALIAVGLVAIG
jgi:hypothetical protein